MRFVKDFKVAIRASRESEKIAQVVHSVLADNARHKGTDVFDSESESYTYWGLVASMSEYVVHKADPKSSVTVHNSVMLGIFDRIMKRETAHRCTEVVRELMGEKEKPESFKKGLEYGRYAAVALFEEKDEGACSNFLEKALSDGSAESALNGQPSDKDIWDHVDDLAGHIAYFIESSLEILQESVVERMERSEKVRDYDLGLVVGFADLVSDLLGYNTASEVQAELVTISIDILLAEGDAEDACDIVTNLIGSESPSSDFALGRDDGWQAGNAAFRDEDTAECRRLLVLYLQGKNRE